jgi:hypothetical protein
VLDKTFLNILQITRSRVETVIENFAVKNIHLREKTAGGVYRQTRTVEVDEKVEAIIRFPIHNGHYCCLKLGVQKYLSKQVI